MVMDGESNRRCDSVVLRHSADLQSRNLLSISRRYVYFLISDAVGGETDDV